MNPLFRIDFSISDSLKIVRKSVLIYDTIINGIQIALDIYERFPYCLIVFLTSHSEFMEEGYKVRAFRFIDKLLLEEKLPDTMADAEKELGKLSDRCLTVQHYSELLRIPHREIVYVRHILRFSEITTVSGTKIKDNRGLKAILALLNDERFILIDRSAFINLDFIRQIKANQVFLSNGEKLSISRHMLPILKETVNRLWGE